MWQSVGGPIRRTRLFRPAHPLVHLLFRPALPYLVLPPPLVRLPLLSFGQSYFGKFFLQGPLAPAAVQWLCGADMDQKAVGSVTYTPLCNANGGTEADLTVTRLGPQARPNTTQPHHTTPHRTDGKALRVPRRVAAHSGTASPPLTRTRTQYCA